MQNFKWTGNNLQKKKSLQFAKKWESFSTDVNFSCIFLRILIQ